MSIVILFNQKKTKDWEDTLRLKLPNAKIEVYPNVENFDDVDFLITWKPHQNYLSTFPNLKVIHSVGAGIDHLLPISSSNPIKVARIVDDNLKQDMFEHILTCILNSLKNFNQFYDEQKLLQWKPKKYKTFNQTNVTIFGLGEIGKYVAKQLSQLGIKVSGWSSSDKNLENIQVYFGDDQFLRSYQNADIIINLLPLTTKTKNIFNESFFKHCKPYSVFINVGRGGHVVENDLINALDNNYLSYAYLDVFTTEPLPENHPFWFHKKIFITPHIASITNVETAVQQVVDNYANFLEGKDLLNQVDILKEY